jgi:hypothetical protein
LPVPAINSNKRDVPNDKHDDFALFCGAAFVYKLEKEAQKRLPQGLVN